MTGLLLVQGVDVPRNDNFRRPKHVYKFWKYPTGSAGTWSLQYQAALDAGTNFTSIDSIVPGI